jgi:putative ubiquitin-RnfH superfamily antitoxin RatB of RatAB toxin-antitoxin module
MADELLEVEVAYARPDEQVILALAVPAGSTIEDASRRSSLLERFPEIDLASNKVGVFGKVGKLDQTLVQGDRVEIYRPLIADPK